MGKDSTESLIKLAVAGVVGYFVYSYLQTSGLWAEWFGGASSITTVAQLQAYCAQNPTGSATFNGSTTTCSAWTQAIAAQNAPANTSPTNTSTGTPSTTTTNPPTGSVDQSVLTQLVNDMGGSMANIDQWNYYYVKIVPGSIALDPSMIGLVRDANGNTPSMSATQYLQYRSGQGLSSLPGSPFARPYSFGRPN